MKTPTPGLPFWCATVCLLLLVAPASAITITWTNLAGGVWAGATNWSPNQVPVAADVAVISGTATFAVVVTGSRSASGLVLDNPNATLLLRGQAGSGVATLTVANGFENHGAIVLTNQDSSSWAATLNVTSGTLTNMPGGTIRTFVGAGGNRTLGAQLDNRGTLDLEQSTSINKSGGKHRFAGTVHLAAGTTLTISTGGLVETTHAGANWIGTGTLAPPGSNRPFILETDFTVNTITLDLQGVLIQGPGQFIVPAGKAVLFYSTTADAPLNLAGTLENWASSSINGAFNIAPGALVRLLGRGSSGVSALTVANGFENHGTIVLTNQESSSWAVTLNVTAGTLTNATTGVIRTFVGAGGNRTLGAHLDNRGTLLIEQSTTLNKSGGKHRFVGTVNLAAGTTLAISTGGLVETTHAGANWTGTGTLSLPGNNRPFTLETDFTVSTVTLDLQGVLIQGPGQFNVPADKAVRFYSTTADAPLNLAGTLENWASSSINGPFDIAPGALVRLLGRGSSGVSTLTVANGFENRGTIVLTNQESSSWAVALNVTAGTLTNASGGLLHVLAGVGGNRTLGFQLDNRGALLVETNVTLNEAAADHVNTGLIEVLGGELTLLQSGATPTFNNSGELRVLAGATFRPTAGNWTNAPTGVLSGSGTFNLTAGTLANLGTVAPGTSSGILGVTANYPQTAGALLALEIGGFTPGSEHDQLAVSATANLNGTIRAALINSFFPKKDDAFTVLTYTSRSGSFASLQSAEPHRIAWRVDYGPTSAQLIVENSAPTFTPVGNQTVNEATLLAIAARATDQDLPAQILTYSLDVAPPGMTINPGSGLMEWTPTEAQGPGVYPVTVRATDNGTPVLFHTNSFTVTVNEVNVAPQLTVPGPQSVNELVELVFTISATDADLPANALTYQMLSGPTGATFNPATREFRWIPTEAQGPGISNAVFRVTDNNLNAVNTQQLSATNSVAITINEVNVAPQLAFPGPQSVNELVELVFTINSTDADLPANTVTYQMLSGPTGATFNSTTREFRWPPTEAQGPGISNAVFRVTDNNPNAVNTQQLSATNSVVMTINEVNVAPVLTAVPDTTIHAGTTYTNTLLATDADLPANLLTYSLVSGPAGATVGSGSGLVSWTAPLSAAGATTNFTVRVTDDGVPPLPADRSFQIAVAGPVEITGYERETGGFRVDWRSVPGLTYRLLSTPALPATQWNPVGADLVATTSTSSRLDSSASVTNNRFYRVLLVE